MTLGFLHRLRSRARSALTPDGSDTLDRAAFLMLLAFIIAEPFLYGTILPASLDAGAPAPLGSPLLNVFAFLTAAAALLSRSALLQARPLRLPLGAAGGLTLLGVVQLLPLPEGVMQQIASVNLQIYHETTQILRLFGSSRTPDPKISIAPWETASALLGLLACVALFLAAASLLRTRTRRRVFGWAVLVSAGLQLPRLAAFRSGLDGLTASIGIDAAAAAACLGIALCVVFGMIWAEVLTNQERGIDSPDAAERFERRFAPVAGRVILWLALAAGLASLRESSAIVSASVATLVLFGLAFARRRQDISRRLEGSTIALLIFGLLLAARAGASASNPATGVATHMSVWKTSIAAWQQFPVFGSGLGTFREAFRRVQPRDLQALVDRAQSGPLELLVTGGLIGMALGATVVASLLVLFLRAWRSQKHREESAITLGAFGALLFWTLSSLIDSGGTPLIASALLAPVLGAGWAASQARGGRIL
jgi:hypothetical protein